MRGDPGPIPRRSRGDPGIACVSWGEVRGDPSTPFGIYNIKKGVGAALPCVSDPCGQVLGLHIYSGVVKPLPQMVCTTLGLRIYHNILVPKSNLKRKPSPV